MIVKTRREKLQEAARQERRRVALERWFEPKVKRELKRGAKEAGKAFLEGGLNSSLIVLEDSRKRLEDLLFSFYERCVSSSSAGFKAWMPTIETKDFFGAVDRLLSYFKQVALTNSISILETSKKEVVEIMEPMIKESASQGEIAKAIEGKLIKHSMARATLIARTEAGIATSKSQFDIAMEVETLPMKKEWVAFLDSRTRDWHRDVDGETIEKDQYFYVNGDRMLHPHDKGAKAENVINCRCKLIFVPAFDLPEFDEDATYD